MTAEHGRSPHHESETCQPPPPETPGQGAPARSGGPRVGMVVFSHYPSDPRVRRAAEAYTEDGMPVDVICLRGEGQAKRETVRGVRVFRLPIRQTRTTKLRYLLEYALFLTMAGWQLTCLHLLRHYRLVHVHNMPDVLVFTGFIAKLTGAKLILDLHDPMPEVFMTKFDAPYDHWMIRILRHQEKLSLWLADLALTPNRAFVKTFLSRSCPATKMHIVMNAPQEEIFLPTRAQPESDQETAGGRFVLMYHGLIVERHGLDTALLAVNALRDQIPGLHLKTFGSGDSFVETFMGMMGELKLEELVTYHGYRPLETIAREIGDIDLGLIPNKRSPFTDLNFPTRIFEYLCLNKPVVAPRTPGIEDYFDDDSIFFFEPGSADSLAETILRAYRSAEERRRRVERGRVVYEEHCWAVQKARLLGLARGLVGKTGDDAAGADGTRTHAAGGSPVDR